MAEPIMRMSDPLTVEAFDNHIRFWSEVNSDRVLALVQQIAAIDDRLRNEHTTRGLSDTHPRVPIWLHINSPGGSLFDALAAVGEIEKLQTPVYAVVEGVCASAATLLALACTERHMHKRAVLLIHQMSGWMGGKYEEFKDFMKLADHAMELLVQFYVEHSNVLEEEEVREMLKRDTWLTADEAKEKGFVDKVL